MKKYKSVADFFETEVPKEIAFFVDMNMAVSNQIMYYLKEKKWTQKQLAKELGKSEAEISKWLSGTHNLTMKSIARIAAILDREIITTPLEAKEKYKEVKYIKLGVSANTNTPKVNYQYTSQVGIKKKAGRKKQLENNAA